MISNSGYFLGHPVGLDAYPPFRQCIKFERKDLL